jgi:septal ring factor EnvC (AmiA/AmiB activator)
MTEQIWVIIKTLWHKTSFSLLNQDHMNNDQVHKSIDRLDRRISTLTDKVAELKKTVYQNEDDMGGNNTNEEAAFDKDGKIDAAAT